MASTDQATRARRPHWRGERKAVLVRVPVEVAERLVQAAKQADRSVSDYAAEVIMDALEGRPA